MLEGSESSIPLRAHLHAVHARSRLQPLPLGLLCKPQTKTGPSQRGCWWCLPPSPVPPPNLQTKHHFPKYKGNRPSSSKPASPQSRTPFGSRYQRSDTLLHTALVSCLEKQTHLCSDLYLTAGDPCSVTSFSEFVLHGHKLGNKMSLPFLCVSRATGGFSHCFSPAVNSVLSTPFAMRM